MSGHDRFALAEWQRIRRYAVPEWMIAECTQARERGDWREACAAGRIDVAFDPELADRAGELAAGLAPDLLRWHLPRALGGYTTLATERHYVLLPQGPVEPDTVVLTVKTPVSVLGSQRLTLGAREAGDLGERRHYPLPAYLWEARSAGGLRAAVGGSERRLPLFTPAGDPLPDEQLGAGDDLPALAERVRLAPTVTEAFAAAGSEIADDPDGRWKRSDHGPIMTTVDPLRLAHDVRRLAAWYQPGPWALWVDYWSFLKIEVDGDAVRVARASVGSNRSAPERALPRLHTDQVRFAPDLDLIRHGRLSAAGLHPLVRSALFPDAPAQFAARAEPGPVRIRCRGDWHEVEHRAGRLRLLAHTTAEQQRERAMRAFGGEVTGCFATEQTWTGATGRLPRRLREHREDLWQRMIHGGTRVVLDLLDAGLDPKLTDSRGRTLLHRVRSFDHARLLPRLLAEGLDVNARDREGSTPLYLAVTEQWPAELIKALVDAGGDPHAPNGDDMSVIDYLDEVLEYRDDLDPGFEAAIAYLRKRA